MGFRIFVMFEMTMTIETQEAKFFVNLHGYHRRHRASVHLIGDLRASVNDDIEPIILTGEPPTHAGLCDVPVPVTKYFGMALTE